MIALVVGSNFKYEEAILIIEKATSEKLIGCRTGGVKPGKDKELVNCWSVSNPIVFIVLGEMR